MTNAYENNHVPAFGKYTSTLVQDASNKMYYFYDDCGSYSAWSYAEVSCSDPLSVGALPVC